MKLIIKNCIYVITKLLLTTSQRPHVTFLLFDVTLINNEMSGDSRPDRPFRYLLNLDRLRGPCIGMYGGQVGDSSLLIEDYQFGHKNPAND